MQTTSPSLMDLVTDRQQPAPFSQIWTINWHKRWTNWTLFVNREELREVVVHMVGPWRTGKPACLYQAGTAPADILLPRRLNCLQSPDVFRLSSLATSVSVLSQQIVFGNTSCSVCENNTHHIRLVSFVRAMHTILICLVCSISKSNAHDICLVCSVCDSNTCYICLVCSVCESNTCCICLVSESNTCYICLVCSICQEHPSCSEQAEGDDVHKAGGGGGNLSLLGVVKFHGRVQFWMLLPSRPSQPSCQRCVSGSVWHFQYSLERKSMQQSPGRKRFQTCIAKGENRLVQTMKLFTTCSRAVCRAWRCRVGLGWVSLAVLHWWSLAVLHWWSLAVLHWWSLAVLHWWSLAVLHWWNLAVLHWWNLAVLHWWSLAVLHWWSLAVLHWWSLAVLHWLRA